MQCWIASPALLRSATTESAAPAIAATRTTIGARSASCATAGAVPKRNDNVACAYDFCSTSQGQCINSPDHGACDDGLFCDGAETCGASGCQSAPAIVCPSDGIACTVDECDKTFNACVSRLDSTLCTNPQHDCVPGQGCGNTCVVTTCQGKVYARGDCVDNDGDGLMDAKAPHAWGRATTPRTRSTAESTARTPLRARQTVTSRSASTEGPPKKRALRSALRASRQSGSNETCVVELTASTPIQVMVRGWHSSSDYSLVGKPL